MSNRNHELQILEDEIDSMDEQIKNHCIVWAQEHYASLSDKDKPGEVNELNDTVSKIDNKINRIKELTRNIDDYENRIKEIKQSESEEYKSRGNFYQLLGKRSFELYKKNQILKSEEIDEIFAPLMNYENQIRTADNELYRIRSKNENSRIWEKVGGLIKKSTQTAKKKSAGDGLNKQYKKTGESLINKGFFNEIAQNGLSDIYDEFQDKENQSRKFNEELAELARKIDEAEKEIAELSESKGANKGIKNLEMILEETEMKLDNTFLRQGQELYGSEDKINEPYRVLIDSLNRERNIKMNQKTALLIEIRVNELNENLEKKIKDLAQQKEKLGREQEKLDSLEEERISLETKIIQLNEEHEQVLKTVKGESHD